MDHEDPAGSLVRRLGITHASDIDLEAIARSLGVKIRVGVVETCEARLIGYRDRAIITVGPGGDWRRRRFSIAHELGHWHHHRGRVTLCDSSDIEAGTARRSPIEREADDYAAKLLMPAYLFTKSVQQRTHRTLGVVAALAYEYRTSRLATLLRIIDLDLWPCMVVCRLPEGKGWSRKSRSFQIAARLRRDVHSRASLAALSGLEKTPARQADIAKWFVDQPPIHVGLIEQSCRTFGGGVLTLLTTSLPARGKSAAPR